MIDPEYTAVAGSGRDRQRLPGQRGLVHLHRVTRQQPRIRRHDVAHPHPDHVTRHQLTRRRGDPRPVTYHPALDRQLGLQRIDGLARLVLLPEPDRGVGNEQDKDDEEIRPVPQHARQDHRGLDHPRDRTPEIGQQFQERIFLLLLDLIRPVPGQPLLRLGLAQAIRRRPQPLLHLRQGKRLQLILRIGLRSRRRGPASDGFPDCTHPFLLPAAASHSPAAPAAVSRLATRPCPAARTYPRCPPRATTGRAEGPGQTAAPNGSARVGVRGSCNGARLAASRL